MKKIIIVIVLLIAAIQTIPPCGKFDRNRYVVAPACTPQPIRPIEPIGLH